MDFYISCIPKDKQLFLSYSLKDLYLFWTFHLLLLAWKNLYLQ